MKVQKMKLSELTRPARNIRMHTETQLKEFERSVTMFGQIRPIIVDEKKEILAGNGLYDTLLRLGWEEADVYQIDDLTANQKLKLMIADNKIYSLGVDDLETFDAFLLELDGDLDVPGFDEDILRSMVCDSDDITAAIADYGKLSEEEIEGVAAAGDRKQRLIEHQASGAEPVSGRQDDKPAPIICPKCGAEIWQ